MKEVVFVTYLPSFFYLTIGLPNFVRSLCVPLSPKTFRKRCFVPPSHPIVVECSTTERYLIFYYGEGPFTSDCTFVELLTSSPTKMVGSGSVWDWIPCLTRVDGIPTSFSPCSWTYTHVWSSPNVINNNHRKY